MRTTFLGIEIGGTKLQFALAGKSGPIHTRRTLKVDPVLGAPGIRDQIAATVKELFPGQGPATSGVGFGGPVDRQTGRICRSHQIEGWSEFDMAGWLGKLVGGLVVVENDANTAALGEALRGAGKGCATVLYVTLGSGVGGGLVVGGQIYHGALPGEAEIGHVRLDRKGTTLESRCSGWAVDRRVRALKRTAPGSVLARLAAADPGSEARHLAEALRRKDTAARRLFGEIVDDLAFGLSHAVHLFHPEIIILGGGLSSLGEMLRRAVEEKLAKSVMDAFAASVRVSLTALGTDAVPAGAIELARAYRDPVRAAARSRGK